MLPVWNAVLCSIVTPVAPLRIWNRVPDPSRSFVPTSTNRLLAISSRIVLPALPGERLSIPRMLIPEAVLRTTLFVKVTSCTTAQGATSPSVRTVNRIPNPFCASAQLFSSTLCSTSTRRAFFSSKMFLTDQRLPSNDGSSAFQARGL